MTKRLVGAVGTSSAACPRRGGRVLCVHGDGSVHAPSRHLTPISTAVTTTQKGHLQNGGESFSSCHFQLDDAERFARHLATEFAAVFLFLWDLSIDATNWRAEQAIRPAVVIRKVCGGNRTRHGADTQQVLASP